MINHNYSFSMGAQQMDSMFGNCQTAALYWYPGGFLGNGQAGHGNTVDPNIVSGVVSRQQWGAKLGQITDGLSLVILAGEVLPECSDHAQAYGPLSPNSLWMATNAPINFPSCLIILQRKLQPGIRTRIATTPITGQFPTDSSPSTEVERTLYCAMVRSGF